MKKIIAIIICVPGLTGLRAHAQDSLLTLQNAIGIALENNYQVLIAENEQEIARYNRNVGNAGMLPFIGIDGTANFATSEINQAYANGTDFQQSGVRSDNYNAGVSLQWTLFDGLKMFATYGRLTALKEQGMISTRLAMENTIYAVMLAYFNVVSQQQLIRAATQNIKIYEERLKIAEAKYTVGVFSKVDQLLAKLDLNAQRSALINYETILYQQKVELNRLLARPAETQFMVDTVIPLNEIASLESLKGNIRSKNNEIQYQSKFIDIAKYTKREVNSLRYPLINFNASYRFSRSVNQAGFALFNQNLGLSGGFTLSMPVFDGWKINTQARAAKFLEKNAVLFLSSEEQRIEAQLLSVYRNYEAANALLTIEEESRVLAEENVKIALERFRLGQSSTLEIQEAQRSLEAVQIRYADALYKAKSLETELIKLSGGLVRN